MSQTIAFEDIKVGDRIRATYEYDSGDVSVREFTVTSVGETGGWLEGANLMISQRDSNKIELLDRPAPVEPTKVGTVILMGNGRKAIRVPLDIRDNLYHGSPWMYFEPKNTHPSFLMWGEVLRPNFGDGVVEVIEP